MIRLRTAGASTLALSTLCARCPQGPAGCCASPPGIEWSDVGRIVALGGRAFLLAELATGMLRPGPRGLLIRRVEAEGARPRRCAYLGETGCVLAPGRRSATCNYYVCEEALSEAGDERERADAASARRARDDLADRLGRWDLAIAAEVDAQWPGGPAWDGAFLDWLARRYEEGAARVTRAVRRASKA